MIPDRDKRIAKAIYRLLLKIFSFEIRDSLLKDNIIITKVELTKDLSIAKIYFHITNSVENKTEKDYFKHFEKISGFLRKRIAEEINIKYCPSVRFFIDKGYNKGKDVLDLLNKIKNEK